MIRYFLYNFAQIVDVNLPHATAGDNKMKLILNIFFGILGALSVLVIVFAGIQFIVSAGNPEKVAKARNTIYFALIGLVVAVFAGVLVNFVIDRVS